LKSFYRYANKVPCTKEDTSQSSVCPDYRHCLNWNLSSNRNYTLYPILHFIISYCVEHIMRHINKNRTTVQHSTANCRSERTAKEEKLNLIQWLSCLRIVLCSIRKPLCYKRKKKGFVESKKDIFRYPFTYFSCRSKIFSLNCINQKKLKSFSTFLLFLPSLLLDRFFPFILFSLRLFVVKVMRDTKI
jgi:hypothetical protein